MHHRLRIIARSQVSSHDELFECAPPTGLLRRLGLIRPGAANARERALIVIVVAWIPLVALSAIDGGVTTLTAAMAAARYLFAAPLLVIAENACGRRLTSLARHFAIGNFVAERDHRRFERILVSTRMLLRSPIVEVRRVGSGLCVQRVVPRPRRRSRLPRLVHRDAMERTRESSAAARADLWVGVAVSPVVSFSRPRRAARSATGCIASRSRGRSGVPRWVNPGFLDGRRGGVRDCRG